MIVDLMQTTVMVIIYFDTALGTAQFDKIPSFRITASNATG